MRKRAWCMRLVPVLFFLIGVLSRTDAHAQAHLKKIRIGVSETHVGYLPLQVAFHKGYYKDERLARAPAPDTR
jgi:ABC-type nitrate/sulfonate/bicarbonate transport system substrate-binding protein